MIDEKILEEGLKSIAKLNAEMGGVLVAIQWITTIVKWQLSLLGIIFVSVLVNIGLTRRNGRKR